MIAAAIFVIFPLCLALAAFTDLISMTIPNRVSLILVISFLIIAPLMGMAIPEIGMHLAAGLAVFCGCFALFALNVMGGGDAKLLTATAVWFGFNQSLVLFIGCVGLIGGFLTFAILMIRSQSHTILAIGLPVPSSLLLAKKIPYGIAIAIGGFMAFPYSPILIHALETLK
ncbi:prepilin peptidase [Rhizobium mongolense]|uniref:A24 family peptidase n=1 Tax=Rhizobium mongolense TaxID=57676 RepID=UPI003556957E